MTCKDCKNYAFGLLKGTSSMRHYCSIVSGNNIKYAALNRKELKQLASHCKRFVPKLTEVSNKINNEQ